MTYGFLGILLTALITLAVLQYRWLGSVSEAEQERLRENLRASSENFVAEFNRFFSSLYSAYQIQITSEDKDVRNLIYQAHMGWKDNGIYPDLVDSVYYIKNISSENPQVHIFTTDPLQLNPVPLTGSVEKWLKANPYPATGTRKITLNNGPDWGDPSFLAVPVQYLDMVYLREENFGKNIKLSLNINQMADAVVLQLDDELIKTQVMPDMASTYFSESFDDQYQLGIVQSDSSRFVYYNSDEEASLREPDFKTKISKTDFSSFLFLRSNKANNTTGSDDSNSLGLVTSHVEGIRLQNSSIRVDSVSISSLNEKLVKQYDTLKTGDITEVDTTISASFYQDYTKAGWEFWLSLKAGSLEAFVSKTRYKNLAISFGILLILGISGGLIVLFSQRSKELADQQMMFVAGVSHELRTPLSVIRSAAENIADGIISEPEKQKKYAQLMLKEGRRLSEMIDQIMEYSGIQSGKKEYRFNELDTSSYMNDLVNELEPKVSEKGFTLQYYIKPELPPVYADPEALSLCVNNLVSNALKFSDTSKEIRLAAHSEEKDSRKYVAVEVEDYGMGIPEDEQAHIFDAFYRGKRPSAEQIKGNGIGLSLVKKVTEAHGGYIEVKSEVNKGSRFKIFIPANVPNSG